MKAPNEIYRQEYWQVKLVSFLGRFSDDLALHGVVYGKTDCLQLAAQSLAAITGHNPLPDWMLGYSSKRDIYNRMTVKGYRNSFQLIDSIATKCGLIKNESPAQSVPGDIAIVTYGHEPGLGIRGLQGFYTVVHGHKSIVPVRSCLVTWGTPWQQ